MPLPPGFPASVGVRPAGAAIATGVCDKRERSENQQRNRQQSGKKLCAPAQARTRGPEDVPCLRHGDAKVTTVAVGKAFKSPAKPANRQARLQDDSDDPAARLA